MKDRTIEQIEADVEATLAAMRPHLHTSSDEEVARAFEATHPEIVQELSDALLRRELSERRELHQIWIENTRVALGLDEDEEEGERITIETDGRSVKLPPEVLVFPEGSACHGTELLGQSALNRCYFISRRETHFDIFRRVLSPRSKEFKSLVQSMPVGSIAANPKHQGAIYAYGRFAF
jgi:hypothetical protein